MGLGRSVPGRAKAGLGARASAPAAQRAEQERAVNETTIRDGNPIVILST
jgi:hypothetical protein